tara:strand:- start:304 stop:558 length:255 start_codon:yes stop_codon:yes gene_type:complete
MIQKCFYTERCDMIENCESCEHKHCRYWIEYEEDNNCSLISIEKNGKLTLKEVAKRLNISDVRVKQIQDKAIENFKNQILLNKK